MSTLFPLNFLTAFKFSMQYEVGPWFDPTDSDTVAGLCSTKDQRRKTGYVNDPDDAGGETKFGIAKNSHPRVNIKTLTMDEAMQIYYDEFWIAPSCDKMAYPLSVVHFDACVNHGKSGGTKLVQRALSLADDGVIGPKTLSLINIADPYDVAKKQLTQRELYFKNIASRKLSNQKFLKGWLARVESIRKIIS